MARTKSGSGSAGGRVKNLLLMLILVIPITPHVVLADVEKIDVTDDRYTELRDHVFLDVKRTISVDRTYLTVRPSIGYRSQGIRCPDDERAIGHRATGNMILHVPGGEIYYNTGNTSLQDAEIEFGEGDPNWYVSSLTYGAELTLSCQRHDDVMSTRYIGIDKADNNGLLPEPRCEVNSRGEVCYVLGLKLKAKLAEMGWDIENIGSSIEGHQDLVRRFNEQILNPEGEKFSKEEEQIPQQVEESVTEVEQSQQIDEERTRKQALAASQRMDGDDPRIDAERGETFVRVMRTIKSDETIVTAKAPLGYWTQRLDGCPGGDRPNGVRLSGHVLFWTENPLAYYEESEPPRPSSSIGILEDILAKGNWRVTGLADSSYVILDCPRSAESMSTEYISIESPNEEGLIHQPKCQIESGHEVCFVLGLNLVSELAENGWTTYHSVEGHAELVNQYNQHVRKYGQHGPSIQNRMRFANVNAMLWYIAYAIVIAMCTIVFRNWR